jgi:hypothetical protein
MVSLKRLEKNTGEACSEESHSLRNPVLSAQAPRKEKKNRTLADRKMKCILRNIPV